MALQKIFTAGNSQVVAIPKEVMSSLQLNPGELVQIISNSESQTITISKTTKTKRTTKNKASKKAFTSWLNSVLKEDAALLENLSNR